MSQSRLQLKVGVFVFFCLILVAALLIQFSKGMTLFHETYDVILKTANVGGLRPSSSVLMSGVQVGTVSGIELAPQGTNVSIVLKIYNRYVIRNDARFVIEQSGFLGDQYVAIYPDKNQGMSLTNGEEMPAQEPFNLQEVARSASGFIKHIDDTASNLNAAILDVRREVLNERTLTNLAFTIDTLERVSVNAGTVVDNLNSLIISNGVPAGTAVSNLLIFSQQMNTFAQSAQGILDTNRPEINAAISNLHNSTVMLTNLLAEVRDGKGLVGTLLSNEDLANHVSDLASNLAVASANLNRLGLWHFLWYHPKPTPTNAPPPARSGPNH